jgi:hypothetical protein
MKKIIDIDFTNFKLPSVVFFCNNPPFLVDSRFNFLIQIAVDRRLLTVDLNFTPTSLEATPPSL